MRFYFIKLRNRPLLALPCGSWRLRKAGIACYPGHTWKKRVVRAGIQMISCLGLIRLFFQRGDIPLPGVSSGDFERWLESVGHRLGVDRLYPVWVWPADPDRGRIYLYLLNNSGASVGFCKFGFDSKNNALIARERDALERLKLMKLTRSRIPKLLESGELGNCAYVVVETTPPGTRIIDWRVDASIDGCIDEYAGETLRISKIELESQLWWVVAKEMYADQPSLLDSLNQASKNGINVCFAHGDLNRTNILLDDGDVWLLDWEQSNETAPRLTDRVCVAVDTLWLEHSGEVVGGGDTIRDLIPSFHSDNPQDEIFLALVFLSVAGFPPAQAWSAGLTSPTGLCE